MLDGTWYPDVLQLARGKQGEFGHDAICYLQNRIGSFS